MGWFSRSSSDEQQQQPLDSDTLTGGSGSSSNAGPQPVQVDVRRLSDTLSIEQPRQPNTLINEPSRRTVESTSAAIDSPTSTPASASTAPATHTDSVNTESRWQAFLYGTKPYYVASPDSALDTGHVNKFISKWKKHQYPVSAVENQYIVDCMNEHKASNTAALFTAGALGWAIGKYMYPSNKWGQFLTPFFTAGTAFAFVGFVRLQQCHVAMVENTELPMAVDYRYRLEKENPLHPVVLRWNKHYERTGQQPPLPLSLKQQLQQRNQSFDASSNAAPCVR